MKEPKIPLSLAYKTFRAMGFSRADALARTINFRKIEKMYNRSNAGGGV